MSLNGNTDKAVSLLREAASLFAGDRESDDTAVSTAGRVVTGTETVVTNSVSSSSHDQNSAVARPNGQLRQAGVVRGGSGACPPPPRNFEL